MRGDDPWRWLALMLVAVTLPMVPILSGQATAIQHDVWISDLLHAQLPYRLAVARSIGAGELPLWLPDIFSGVPLLAQLEAGVFYPLHWLLFLVVEPTWALGLALGGDTLLAALGTWLLLRRLGCSGAAAALGGLVFAWSGFMLTHHRHPNMHAAAAWLPWAVWALEGLLASRGRRGGPLLAVIIGVQLSAGHPQVSYYTGLLLAARTLTFVAGPGRPRFLSTGLAVALATALGGALMAVQLLPASAFSAASLSRVAPTWEYATAFPFDPIDLLGLVAPRVVGSMETYDYINQSTSPWGNYAYLGLLPLLLAAISLFDRAHRRRTVFWGGVALASMVLVLGHHTPLYGLLWSSLPGLDLFRFPNRFLVIFTLAVAVLAAGGLDLLLSRLPETSRELLPVVVIIATLADLGLAHGPRLPLDARAVWASPGPLPAGLEAAGLGGQRVVVVDELKLWERAFHEARGFLEGPEPYRRQWILPLGSSGIRQGIPTATGYTRMVHHRTAAFWQVYNTSLLTAVHQPWQPSADDPRVSPRFAALMSRAGVAGLVSQVRLEAPSLELRSTAPLGIYANPQALPAAYLAATWHPVDDLDGAAAWMLEEGLKQLAVPALEGDARPPPTVEAGLQPLDLERRAAHALELRLPPGHQGGLLVINQSTDSGWRATVDDAPAELLAANGYQQGVLVEPGDHRVALRYEPPGLRKGLLVSGLAVLSLLGWAVVGRARREDVAPGRGAAP